MSELKKHIEIIVEVPPEEVAKMFCDMHSDHQALFFNAIANEIKNWKRPFVYQLQHITDEPLLTNEGRDIMREIGEYSGHQLCN